MSKQSTKRLSLEAFKASAAAASVSDQLQSITGGALSGCHTPAAFA